MRKQARLSEEVVLSKVVNLSSTFAVQKAMQAFVTFRNGLISHHRCALNLPLGPRLHSCMSATYMKTSQRLWRSGMSFSATEASLLV